MTFRTVLSQQSAFLFLLLSAVTWLMPYSIDVSSKQKLFKPCLQGPPCFQEISFVYQMTLPHLQCNTQ